MKGGKKTKEDCKFCEEVIQEALKSRKAPFDNISEKAYDYYFNHTSVREANCFCRAVPVCNVHMRTLKKDNKKRASKGLKIPDSLETITKLSLSDI